MTLEERFRAPSNWQWGRISPRPEQHLRYGWHAPENPRALVFIFPGLSEYIEKYFETVNDLAARGFASVVVDWRGHGLSWRHLPKYRHADSFDQDIEDAFLLIDTVNADPKLAHLPRILLAHSMGAHFALRVLHDRPGLFHCAVLNAPLQGLPMLFDGSRLQLFMAGLLNKIAGRYSTGTVRAERPSANLDFLTSDPLRRGIKEQLLRDNPALISGSVTFGWVYAAIKSMRITNRQDYLNQIKLPILITVALNERIVSNAAIRRTLRFLPNATAIDIPGALHEVLMEQDKYRNQFWHAFDAFMDKVGIAG